MLVRALKLAAGELSFRPGQEFEVTDQQAEALLADQAVELVEAPVRRKRDRRVSKPEPVDQPEPSTPAESTEPDADIRQE